MSEGSDPLLQEHVRTLEAAGQASKKREQALQARLATAQADVAHLRNILHDASVPPDVSWAPHDCPFLLPLQLTILGRVGFW